MYLHYNGLVSTCVLIVINLQSFRNGHVSCDILLMDFHSVPRNNPFPSMSSDGILTTNDVDHDSTCYGLLSFSRASNK